MVTTETLINGLEYRNKKRREVASSFVWHIVIIDYAIMTKNKTIFTVTLNCHVNHCLCKYFIFLLTSKYAYDILNQLNVNKLTQQVGFMITVA